MYAVLAAQKGRLGQQSVQAYKSITAWILGLPSIGGGHHESRTWQTHRNNPYSRNCTEGDSFQSQQSMPTQQLAGY